MCKIYGYCRVSTPENSTKKNEKTQQYERKSKQDYERQKYIFENSGIEFDCIFEEHISGGVKGNQRQEFNKMLELLQPTDIVCFTETSRFGRNYIDCFDMLDIITQEKQATVRFLSNGIELKGGERLNPYEWLTISNFFIMDEFLKRQIGYNTKNALAKKKADGITLGRPNKRNEQRDNVLELSARGKTGAQIATELGLSAATVSRIIKDATNA